MDGLINFNKPVGITSAKALYRVRAITRQKKSGHAGTLDPAASGVLLLCLGKGTKLVERLMDQPKVYRTTARLDVTSESFDSDRPLLRVPVIAPPERESVEQTLAKFQGVIQQVPPAISAIKVGGVPSYKLAARDQAEPLKSRPVRIDWIRLHTYDWPTIDFEMCCGRGTYVRSLIRDLGVALGTGGCLTSLARTRVGAFHINEAWSFDRLETAKPEDYLISVERVLAEAAGIPPVPGPSRI